MKAFTAAAVQIAPLPGPLTAESVKGNLAKAADWVTRCVDATGAELVVLPESVTTGFTPGHRPRAALGPRVGGPRPGRRAAAGDRPPARRARGRRHLRARRRARRRLQRVGAARPGRRGGRRLPQDAPVLHRDALPRRLGHARRRGQRGRDRPRPHRADHLLRRRLPRAVPDHRGARRRGHRPPVGAAAVGRHLGADQPGPGLRQPRLRRRRQRHRHRPRRRPLLRQLDDRDAGRRGRRAGRQPRVLGHALGSTPRPRWPR